MRSIGQAEVFNREDGTSKRGGRLKRANSRARTLKRARRGTRGRKIKCSIQRRNICDLAAAEIKDDLRAKEKKQIGRRRSQQRVGGTEREIKKINTYV